MVKYYNKIKCGSNSIFKIKVDGLDNQIIIDELFEYKSIGYELNVSTDILISPNIRKMYSNCYEALKLVYMNEYKRPIKNSYQSGWVFELPNDVYGGDYHKHLQLSPLYSNYATDVAWVYYLQLPNNLIGNEGKILFKDNDGNEAMIMPELGYLYSFPSDLDHKPEKTTKSTVSRIVAVANTKFNW